MGVTTEELEKQLQTFPGRKGERVVWVRKGGWCVESVGLGGRVSEGLWGLRG